MYCVGRESLGSVLTADSSERRLVGFDCGVLGGRPGRLEALVTEVLDGMGLDCDGGMARDGFAEERRMCGGKDFHMVRQIPLPTTCDILIMVHEIRVTKLLFLFGSLGDHLGMAGDLLNQFKFDLSLSFHRLTVACHVFLYTIKLLLFRHIVSNPVTTVIS